MQNKYAWNMHSKEVSWTEHTYPISFGNDLPVFVVSSATTHNKNLNKKYSYQDIPKQHNKTKTYNQ